MLRFSFASLRVRLSLFVLLTALPGLGLTLCGNLKQHQLEKTHVREKALLLTRVVTSYEEKLIEGSRQLLTALAQVPQVRGSDSAVCNALLTNLLKKYPRYAMLGVANRNGDVFCSAIQAKGDFVSYGWLQRVVKARNFAVGEYEIGRISHKAVLVFGYPVLDPAGGVQSVVFASLDLAWLNQLGTKVKLPQGASLIVVDRNGTVLAQHANSENSVGKSFENASIFKKILAQGEGVTEVSGVDGILHMYAFTLLKDLPDTNAYMGIGISQADPFASADQNLARNLTELGLVATLVIAAAWVTVNKFILWSGVRVVGSILGIPDHKRAEELLRESEERFRQIAENIREVLWISDPDVSQILYVNPVYEEVWGCTCESLYEQPRSFLDKIHPQDRHLMIAALAKQNSGKYNEEYRIVRSDGSVRWVRFRVFPIRSKAGQVYRIVGLVEDISNRKHAEADIRQLNETLQRLLERTADLETDIKELDSFSYSVSHDLRAPLRHIRGFVDALAQQLKLSSAIADPKVAHYIKIIQQSTQKMGQLIDGLLALSRVGRQQIAYQPVELRPLVENAIALVICQTEIGKEHSIEFTIDNLPMVMGDTTLLQQVFSNLIDNAVKFSRDRYPIRILIGSTLDGTIFVKDNGVGFQMEYANHLFGAFQRLHLQREFQGTGIGLAIVQRIIHRHGGTIWAVSAPNQGATFYFKLRRELAPQTTERERKTDVV